MTEFKQDAFKKPPTVTFTFKQKRFDKTGEVIDDQDVPVYQLKDLGDDHTFSLKTYPMEIRRSKDTSFAFIITWRHAAEDCFVTGLTDQYGELKFKGGLLNDDFGWRLPDGSHFEWDGSFGRSWNLLDYRIPQPYSMTPAIVAQYTPQASKEEPATVEILREAIGVPDFLDHVVACVLWLEYQWWEIRIGDEGVAVVEAIGQGARKGARHKTHEYLESHE